MDPLAPVPDPAGEGVDVGGFPVDWDGPAPPLPVVTKPTSGANGFAAAVIVAAGRGTRLGAPDKVFLPLAGQPILAHVLDAVERARTIRDVILVVGEHTRATAEDLVMNGPYAKVLTIVTGGERRQDSVAAGVAAVPSDAEVVIVHDGARPLAPAPLFDRCADAARRSGAAIAGVPVSDTLKRVDNNRVTGTIARDGLWAAQTPQAFRRESLQEAIARLDPTAPDSIIFGDEASLFEALHLPVMVVPGASANLKVTRPEDLAAAEALLARGVHAAWPDAR